jgi:hypothetical protein
MRGLVLLLAVLAVVGTATGWPSASLADSCVSIEGATITNGCQTCMKVTVRSLRPAEDRSQEVFTGEARAVQVEAGAQAASPFGRSAITDLKKCN